jgi:DNA-binding transcriptional LysR family regulator
VSCDKHFKYIKITELRQIRSFLSVAETLRFGRTAEMIHLSQPALSLQIRALEDEIGVRLFERNRRVLRDVGIIPDVRQTAGEMPTLISLVDSGIGVAILPASAVKVSAAAVVACEIADKIPMSEIGMAIRKGNPTAVVDNFRSLALEK